MPLARTRLIVSQLLNTKHEHQTLKAKQASHVSASGANLSASGMIQLPLMLSPACLLRTCLPRQRHMANYGIGRLANSTFIIHDYFPEHKSIPLPTFIIHDYFPEHKSIPLTTFIIYNSSFIINTPPPRYAGSF